MQSSLNRPIRQCGPLTLLRIPLPLREHGAPELVPLFLALCLDPDTGVGNEKAVAIALGPVVESDVADLANGVAPAKARLVADEALPVLTEALQNCFPRGVKVRGRLEDSVEASRGPRVLREEGDKFRRCEGVDESVPPEAPGGRIAPCDAHRCSRPVEGVGPYSTVAKAGYRARGAAWCDSICCGRLQSPSQDRHPLRRKTLLLLLLQLLRAAQLERKQFHIKIVRIEMKYMPK